MEAHARSHAAYAPLSGTSASNIVTSEVRTRGPNGVNDEFAELPNPTGSAINIGGWLVRASDNIGLVSTRVTISAGVSLQAGQRYLVAHTAYTGTGSADQQYLFRGFAP